MADKTATTQVYRIVIKAKPQAVWDAITKPEWTQRYGYGGRVDYTMKPGGRFVHHASDAMKAVGLPDEMVVGEVIECSAPGRLVQTWHPQFDAATTAEKPTRLTYDIVENSGGLCTLTMTHEVRGAPIVAAMVPGGGDPSQGGGGWPWVLSELKTLLETGRPMLQG